MSDMSDTASESAPPDDLIPAYKAAAIAAMSATTLRRHAAAGRFGQWRHPERSGYFYSRAEMMAERAKFERSGQ